MKRTLHVLWMLCVFCKAHAVGFEEVTVPDPDDKPLAALIWYPEKLPNAANPTSNEKFPLVVISHGTGSNNRNHDRTAAALAKDGFVVIAVTHTGDNFRDLSYVRSRKQLIERPRHITRAIDFMLSSWSHREKVDPDRIAMYGYSAGGFTALVVAGGQPDMTKTEAYCRHDPQAWTCEYLRENGVSLQSMESPPASAWLHDDRVKVAAIAAPAVGYSFEPDGLSQVHIPIQIWSAEHDAIVDESAETIRRMLPASTEFYRVPGAGHFSFISPCDWRMRSIIFAMTFFGTEPICDDLDGFDRANFHQELNRKLAAFFHQNLQ